MREPGLSFPNHSPSAPSASGLTIFVEGLKIHAHIGVYAHETLSSQPLILDIALGLDAAIQPQRDEMTETLDYDWVAQSARDLGAKAHLKLVETYGEQLAQIYLSDPRVRQVFLRIRKPNAIPDASAAGIEIVRCAPAG